MNETKQSTNRDDIRKSEVVDRKNIFEKEDMTFLVKKMAELILVCTGVHVCGKHVIHPYINGSTEKKLCKKEFDCENFIQLQKTNRAEMWTDTLKHIANKVVGDK